MSTGALLLSFKDNQEGEDLMAVWEVASACIPMYHLMQARRPKWGRSRHITHALALLCLAAKITDVVAQQHVMLYV